MKSDQAMDLYQQAYRSEQGGKTRLAEVYYLKSWSLFNEAGGENLLNAANVLNALAFLRWSRKDYESALCWAQQAMRIMETQCGGLSGADADLIRSTSWELVDQVTYEMSLVYGAR